MSIYANMNCLLIPSIARVCHSKSSMTMARGHLPIFMKTRIERRSYPQIYWMLFLTHPTAKCFTNELPKIKSFGPSRRLILENRRNIKIKFHSKLITEIVWS